MNKKKIPMPISLQKICMNQGDKSGGMESRSTNVNKTYKITNAEYQTIMSHINAVLNMPVPVKFRNEYLMKIAEILSSADSVGWDIVNYKPGMIVGDAKLVARAHTFSSVKYDQVTKLLIAAREYSASQSVSKLLQAILDVMQNSNIR